MTRIFDLDRLSILSCSSLSHSHTQPHAHICIYKPQTLYRLPSTTIVESRHVAAGAINSCLTIGFRLSLKRNAGRRYRGTHRESCPWGRLVRIAHTHTAYFLPTIFRIGNARVCAIIRWKALCIRNSDRELWYFAEECIP